MTNRMKKIIQAFHLASLVLTFVLKLRFSADTSIADVIKKRYGTSTLTTYRTWERKKRKYEKAVLWCEFVWNKMKKIIQTFHLASLVLTFILKLRFSADTSIADVIWILSTSIGWQMHLCISNFARFNPLIFSNSIIVNVSDS